VKEGHHGTHQRRRDRGDYSFGWNGFEAETAVRNKLPGVP
jgi:hypothetical protein